MVQFYIADFKKKRKKCDPVWILSINGCSNNRLNHCVKRLLLLLYARQDNERLRTQDFSSGPALDRWIAAAAAFQTHLQLQVYCRTFNCDVHPDDVCLSVSAITDDWTAAIL